jgi:hypothetical protein
LPDTPAKCKQQIANGYPQRATASLNAVFDLDLKQASFAFHIPNSRIKKLEVLDQDIPT